MELGATLPTSPGSQRSGPEPLFFPEAFQDLFTPARYKVYYGGRGGGKTENFARALLLLGTQRPMRIICVREFQNSIRESVHRTLASQIVNMGLEDFYEVLQAEIRGANGTYFAFEGIKHNTSRIKSYSNIDVCWAEEADLVSSSSWEILIPTIRAAKSEIWISFNPGLETDETYQRFVVNPPQHPEGVIVRKVNWRDNPWFPEGLRGEMEALKARDYDAYLHVWEGHCKSILEGAVYAEELREALATNRITKVPYDHTKPVDTFWDLGWSDMTSIWFAQRVGFEIRVIDYYQNRLKGVDHYLKVLQDRGYVYDVDWLPHDAKAKQLVAQGLSIEEQLRTKGRKVRIAPSHSLADGIAAARTIFPQVVFDATRCADGLQCLRHYRYEVSETKDYRGQAQLSRTPKHDWSSHGADAFRYLALCIAQPKTSIQIEGPKPRASAVRRWLGGVRPSPQGWM